MTNLVPALRALLTEHGVSPERQEAMIAQVIAEAAPGSSVSPAKPPGSGCVYYRMRADGGFLAGRPDTGAVAYAFPTSHYAGLARHNPERVALQMVASAETESHLTIHQRRAAATSAREDWIAELREHGTEVPA